MNWPNSPARISSARISRAKALVPFWAMRNGASVGSDLRADHREYHVKAERSSDRDNGRLGDPAIPPTKRFGWKSQQAEFAYLLAKFGMPPPIISNRLKAIDGG